MLGFIQSHAGLFKKSSSSSSNTQPPKSQQQKATKPQSKVSTQYQQPNNPSALEDSSTPPLSNNSLQHSASTVSSNSLNSSANQGKMNASQKQSAPQQPPQKSSDIFKNLKKKKIVDNQADPQIIQNQQEQQASLTDSQRLYPLPTENLFLQQHQSLPIADTFISEQVKNAPQEPLNLGPKKLFNKNLFNKNQQQSLPLEDEVKFDIPINIPAEPKKDENLEGLSFMERLKRKKQAAEQKQSNEQQWQSLNQEEDILSLKVNEEPEQIKVQDQQELIPSAFVENTGVEEGFKFKESSDSDGEEKIDWRKETNLAQVKSQDANNEQQNLKKEIVKLEDQEQSVLKSEPVKSKPNFSKLKAKNKVDMEIKQVEQPIKIDEEISFQAQPVREALKNSPVKESLQNQPIKEQVQTQAVKETFNFTKQKEQKWNEIEQKQESAAVVIQKENINFMERMQEDKNTFILKLTEIVIKQHNLIATKGRLEGETKRLRQQQNQFVKEQAEHAEKDRFEEAEELEEEIKQIIEQIQAADKSILSIQNEYNDLDKMKEDVHLQEINCLEKWMQELSEFKKDKASQREEYETIENKKLKKEKKEIEEETERLGWKQQHLNQDKTQLQQERDNVTESLQKQSSQLIEQETEIIFKENKLEAEVEELKRQLIIKEEELNRIKEDKDSVQLKIKTVKSKFENQLKRLEAKEQRINEDNTKFIVEQENLSEMVNACENHKNIFQSTMSSLEKQTDDINTQRSLLSERILADKRINEARESALSKHADSYAQFVNYQRSLQNDIQKEELLQKDIQQLDESIAELQQKQQTFQDKLPVLDKEKKVLTSQKLFKQAGQVANDIKDINTQLEDISKEIEGKKILQQDIISQNEEIMQRKQSSQKFLKELKKLADIDKYSLLQLKSKDLQVLKQFLEQKRDYANTQAIQSEIQQTEEEIEQIKMEYKEDLNTNNASNNSANSLEQIQSKQNGSIEDKNGKIEGEEEDSENSDQGTQAEIDSQLKSLVNRIKANIAKSMELENQITHFVEAENYDKADELQQIVDALTKKIDQQKEKLSNSFSCLNLEEAEAMIKQELLSNSNQKQQPNEDLHDEHAYSDEVKSQDREAHNYREQEVGLLDQN